MKSKNSKSGISVFSSVKALIIAAMLTAMSVLIGIFCKSFLNFGLGLFRITFENLPIILTGILFGPVAGGIVGCATDLISYLLSPQIYPPNLTVTLGAISIGVVSGIVSRYIIKQQGYTQFIVSGMAAHIVGSMLIKTIGLFSYYGWAVLFRIPLYLVIAPTEILIMCLLYKNNTFKKLLGSITQRRQP